MADASLVLGEGSVELELDEGLYPRDAVYGAAYVFIDRCYVLLDRSSPGRISITLRAKRGGAVDSAAIAGELQNELLVQAWRRAIAEDNRALIESVTTRALAGAAGPPGLEELLAMDIGEGTAFEDPLGIAVSWEEKYAKKNAVPSEAGSTDAAVAAPSAEVDPPEGKGP